MQSTYCGINCKSDFYLWSTTLISYFLSMKVRIYRQNKSAMQSGKANTKKWLVAPLEENNSRSLNSLMGWVSSNNTKNQLRFKFSTKEDAVKFACDSGFEYQIEEPKTMALKPKSYAANFTN
jgi:hypothetical protein